MLGVDAPPNATRSRGGLLAGGIVVVTLVQLLLPGVNHDVRYVIGTTQATAAAGLSWTETWAHRPLVARGIVAGLTQLSPGEFWVREVGLRLWSMVIAAGAAWLLWRGLSRVLPLRMAGWVAVSTGAALAWAPGWDFAEPEWYATALAVAAIGVGLRGRAGPWLAGLLLAVVVLVKYTTAATALVAVVVLTALPAERDGEARRRGLVTGICTAVLTPLLFGLTVLIEPREWQWLRDMPTLNPGFQPDAVAELVEGFANSLVVSPITLVALVAAGWLLWAADANRRRVALLALGCLALLAVPFVVQQQDFLYHLAAVPVAAAAFVAGIAAWQDPLPAALPAVAAFGLLVCGMLFLLGPRTRDQLWWMAVLAAGAVLLTGLVLVLRRAHCAPAPLLIAVACLAALLVTVSPRTTYSFSLAHHRTTALTNLEQVRAAPERRAIVNTRLPPDVAVVYLSFAEPYWLGNPTPCRYASPTFLQRASGEGGDAVARTRSYAENLACLSDPAAKAVVIETGWFRLDRARPEVRAAVATNFDCDRAWLQAEGLVICPRR